MIDPFLEYYKWYPDFNEFTNPIPRPQPIDAVIQFFNGMKNGVFVDVGAYDGVTWSNTLALEKYYGWLGICVEPLDEAYKSLIKERRTTCIKSAVTDFDGEVDFVSISGYAEMLSGIPSSMPDAHVNRIESEISGHGGEKNVTKVKAERLDTILSRENLRKIDYLSMDVECGELNVLKGINWDLTEIKLITCEVNGYTDGRDVYEFLIGKNYKHLGRVCGDEFFAKVTI